MQHAYKAEVKRLIPVLVVTIIVFLVGLSSSLVENVYSNHLYPYIALLLRSISRHLPFPLGDLLYLLLIGFMLFHIFLIVKKAFHRKLIRQDRVRIPVSLLRFLLILYIAFKLLWGLNYSRPPINNRLGIADEKYNNKELIALAELLIKNINQIQNERNSNPATKNKEYSIQELQSAAATSYAELAKRNDFFIYRQPVVKKVLNTWMITKIGLEGYYSPLSGEANLNMRIPAANLPFVTCHEIAHQLGIGREDEANLVGYICATNSHDLNFQYSGNYAVLKNVLFELRIKDPDRYATVAKKLNPGTKADYKKDRNFWMHYNSDMYLYMDVALDSFLKLNNQQKGIDSYQDIVIWLYNLHKRELRHHDHPFKRRTSL
jgi:hypothetical protein